MKQRLITGIFIAIVFVGVVLLSLCVGNQIFRELFFDAFVLVLMILAALEMSKALTTKQSRPFVTLIIATIIVAYGAFYLCWCLTTSLTGSMLSFTAVVLLVALICLILKYKGKKGSFETIFVLVYPIMVLLFMLLINHISPEVGSSLEKNRAAAILLLFLIAPFTDVMAYLVGSTLKGPKLCPSISPKKTISGAVGGLIGGLIGGLLVFFMSISGAFSWMGLASFGTGVEVIHFLIIGLFGSVFVQCGDLTASYVKRKVGIKDYGKLLPGHGGIMDRIDGMMLAAMFIYTYVMIFL